MISAELHASLMPFQPGLSFDQYCGVSFSTTFVRTSWSATSVSCSQCRKEAEGWGGWEAAWIIVSNTLISV